MKQKDAIAAFLEDKNSQAVNNRIFKIVPSPEEKENLALQDSMLRDVISVSNLKMKSCNKAREGMDFLPASISGEFVKKLEIL